MARSPPASQVASCTSQPPQERARLAAWACRSVAAHPGAGPNTWKVGVREAGRLGALSCDAPPRTAAAAAASEQCRVGPSRAAAAAPGQARRWLVSRCPPRGAARRVGMWGFGVCQEGDRLGGGPGGDPGGAGRRTRSQALCIPQVPIPGCHQPPLRNGVSCALLPGGGGRWGCQGSAEGTRTSGHGTLLPSSPRPGPWRRRGKARQGEALGRADQAIGWVPGDQSAAMSLLPAPVPGLPRGPGWLACARHAAGAPRPLPELRRTWRRRRDP